MKAINLLFGLVLILFVSCNNETSISQIETKFVQFDDSTKIAYKEYGKGNPAIVFIHGFGCDVNAWSEQFNYFKDKNRMIFIDLPGYGKSDKPHTEYTLNYYSKSAKSVMDALHVQNAVLVGHSLGSTICRQVVFDYPELVSKMVDVDGVYCFYPKDSVICAENEKMYKMFVSIFQGENMKETMKQFIMPLFIDKTPESVRNYAMTTMMETPQYIANSTMKNMVEKKYWTGEQIHVPSLIIASKNSQIPPEYGQMMSELYSDMQYEELDSIGHFIMMEQPEMFNNMLNQFIQKK